MTAKAPQTPVVSSADDEDPVARSLANAPLDDFPETEEERAAVAAARANPVFVPGAEVTAMLAERRRREEG